MRSAPDGREPCRELDDGGQEGHRLVLKELLLFLVGAGIEDLRQLQRTLAVGDAVQRIERRGVGTRIGTCHGVAP